MTIGYLLRRPVLTFLTLGLCAGLGTAWLALNRLNVVTVGGTMLLSIGILAAVLIEHPIALRPPRLVQTVLGILIVGLGYPGAAICFAVGTILSVRIRDAAAFGYGILDRELARGELVGLLAAALVAATAMALAVWVMTRDASLRLWLIFACSAVIVAGVAIGATRLVRPSEPSGMIDPVFAFTLFPIGCAAFSAIFGHSVVPVADKG